MTWSPCEVPASKYHHSGIVFQHMNLGGTKYSVDSDKKPLFSDTVQQEAQDYDP